MRMVLIGKRNQFFSLDYFSMKTIRELSVANKELDCLIYPHSIWWNIQVEEDFKDKISELK